jgi:hypothetical protein
MASYYASSTGSSDNDEQQILTSAAGSGSGSVGLSIGPSRLFAMSLYPTKVGAGLPLIVYVLRCQCCVAVAVWGCCGGVCQALLYQSRCSSSSSEASPVMVSVADVSRRQLLWVICGHAGPGPFAMSLFLGTCTVARYRLHAGWVGRGLHTNRLHQDADLLCCCASCLINCSLTQSRMKRMRERQHLQLQQQRQQRPRQASSHLGQQSPRPAVT